MDAEAQAQAVIARRAADLFPTMAGKLASEVNPWISLDQLASEVFEGFGAREQQFRARVALLPKLQGYKDVFIQGSCAKAYWGDTCANLEDSALCAMLENGLAAIEDVLGDLASKSQRRVRIASRNTANKLLHYTLNLTPMPLSVQMQVNSLTHRVTEVERVQDAWLSHHFEQSRTPVRTPRNSRSPRRSPLSTASRGSPLSTPGGGALTDVVMQRALEADKWSLGGDTSKNSVGAPVIEQVAELRNGAFRLTNFKESCADGRLSDLFFETPDVKIAMLSSAILDADEDKITTVLQSLKLSGELRDGVLEEAFKMASTLSSMEARMKVDRLLIAASRA